MPRPTKPSRRLNRWRLAQNFTITTLPAITRVGAAIKAQQGRKITLPAMSDSVVIRKLITRNQPARC